MELVSEPLPGVKLLRPVVQEDSRGNFVKTFHPAQLAKHGIDMTIQEEFFSTSNLGVLRGMHFQIPPFAHQKLVYCVKGSVLDVVLDLRSNSPTFGQFNSFELSSQNHHLVYLPIGFAHGFLSLENDSCLIYKTDCAYHATHDKGIRWDSFRFNWPPLKEAYQFSPRDLAHPLLRDFVTPF